MASIKKRGAAQYRVQVRKVGFPVVTKTFEKKSDAQAFSIEVENEIYNAQFIDRTAARQTTFKEALERYAREITPKKKSARSEMAKIRGLIAQPFAVRTLADLRAVDFVKYRDERLKRSSCNTVRLDLALISNLYTIAKKEWSIAVANPIAEMKLPRPGKARDRRLQPGEYRKLLKAAAKKHSQSGIAFCIKLAVRSAMRAGEIRSLQDAQVLHAHGGALIHLADTKNGTDRLVPLTRAAARLVNKRAAQRKAKGEKRLLSFFDSNGLSKTFRELCQEAGIEDLHFHDLRHEAASRLAKIMPAHTLAKICGWKSIQMAMRYYQPDKKDLLEAVGAI